MCNMQSCEKCKGRSWIFFGHPASRQQVTFIVQSTVLILVIIISLINLSIGSGLHDLNISLLSSSLGAFLPGPSFGAEKTKPSLDDIDSRMERRT
jgi:hypothetical protein